MPAPGVGNGLAPGFGVPLGGLSPYNGVVRIGDPWNSDIPGFGTYLDSQHPSAEPTDDLTNVVLFAAGGVGPAGSRSAVSVFGAAQIPQGDTAMTLADFRGEMNEYWDSVNREALEMKDSYLALDRLHSLYQGFDASERALADEVLGEWVLSGSEGKRFDAMALIREFQVSRAVLALQKLADRLRQSADPGAPFEQEKVEGLLSELAGKASG